MTIWNHTPYIKKNKEWNDGRKSGTDGKTNTDINVIVIILFCTIKICSFLFSSLKKWCIMCIRMCIINLTLFHKQNPHIQFHSKQFCFGIEWSDFGEGIIRSECIFVNMIVSFINTHSFLNWWLGKLQLLWALKYHAVITCQDYLKNVFLVLFIASHFLEILIRFDHNTRSVFFSSKSNLRNTKSRIPMHGTSANFYTAFMKRKTKSNIQKQSIIQQPHRKLFSDWSFSCANVGAPTFIIFCLYQI